MDDTVPAVHNRAPLTTPTADSLWTTPVIHDRRELSTAATNRFSTRRTGGMTRAAPVVHSFHSCYDNYQPEKDGVFAIADWGFPDDHP
ncbi:hypothetical protein [Flexivirga lutea]